MITVVAKPSHKSYPPATGLLTTLTQGHYPRWRRTLGGRHQNSVYHPSCHGRCHVNGEGRPRIGRKVFVDSGISELT